MRGLSIRTPQELQAVMGTDYAVSDQQWPAVCAPLEPGVVIAGAGSGKTTLMAARVVYLVATGQVAPEQVLGLTFTTKAASELAADIRAALVGSSLVASGPAAPGPAAPGLASSGQAGAAEERLEPTVATYNSYAAGLLTEQGLRIGHEPDTRVLADASRYQLAARAVARHSGRIELLTDSPKHAIDYLLALESAMSEHLVSIEEVRDFDARARAEFVESLATSRAKKDLQQAIEAVDKRQELLGLVADYRRLKSELGLMDFSDQIARAARLALEHPEVGEAERDRFRVVLLDEYQDTSVSQARLLGALFSGVTPEAGRGHAVTAVGDPNQAIYGWRGASVSNILTVGHTFPRADGSVDLPTYHLTVSRRSDRRILAVANRLAEPLYADVREVRPLDPAPEAGVGEVRAGLHESAAAELAQLAERVLAAQRRITAVRSGSGSSQSTGTWNRIGVLTRDNATAAQAFDALTAAEIPVEIVGLGGLLRLPEVAEVVATLRLLDDLTANAELLTLLSGPRWAIGPRDLALLGRRARALAAVPSRADGLTLDQELERAVTGADPTEILSLSDALEDPGHLPYSTAARERFSLLAGELRMLRRHAGEPLLDLVRLIIDTSGIDLELASSVSPAAPARRDNLDLFVKAVAEFQAIDGAVSLPALLAYLAAEDEMGTGLDVAVPTEADSVKLLTVHRAKGLEWDAVFVVGMNERKFPSANSRSLWTTVGWVLPSPLRGDAADIPQLREPTKQGLEEFRDASRAHEQREELRLGYVALTRARHLLSVSAHWRRYRGSPIGASTFAATVRDAVLEWAGADGPVEPWAEQPEPELLAGADRVPVPWPVTEQTAEALRRLEAAERVSAVDPAAPEPVLDTLDGARVAEWDAELERLLAEVRRDRAAVADVPLPSSLSATSLARLRDDPDGFARDLARPMPRPPSRAARFGTRFHAWVEARFDQQQLLDPDELPGRADSGIDSDPDLAAVVAAFESGPFADRPPYRVEAPFALVLAGQVVRGRIDAVYREPEGSTARFLVVDWKTNRAPTADPLQLALYRLAWAELHDVPLESVRAAFYYVRTGELVEPADLPDRAALEQLIT